MTENPVRISVEEIDSHFTQGRQDDGTPYARLLSGMDAAMQRFLHGFLEEHGYVIARPVAAPA